MGDAQEHSLSLARISKDDRQHEDRAGTLKMARFYEYRAAYRVGHAAL